MQTARMWMEMEYGTGVSVNLRLKPKHSDHQTILLATSALSITKSKMYQRPIGPGFTRERAFPQRICPLGCCDTHSAPALGHCGAWLLERPRRGIKWSSWNPSVEASPENQRNERFSDNICCVNCCHNVRTVLDRFTAEVSQLISLK